MILTIILAASAVQAPICKRLSSEYEDASKKLAISAVEGRGADGDRQVADIRSQANQTLELIKAHKCEPPTSIPSPSPYYSQALACWSDRIKTMDDASAGDPATCDMTKWVRQGNY